MGLYLNLILSTIFFLIVIRRLRDRQKYCDYLLPGWSIVILIFIYSFPVAILYSINPALINETFSRSFSYSTVEGCLACSTVVLAAFWVSELFLKGGNNIPGNRYKSITINLEQYNVRYKFLIICLFCLSIYLYFKRWSSVGGVAQMLAMGRADALYEIDSESGSFARYDIFLFLSSSLLFLYLLLERKIKDKGFLIIMVIAFALFCFVLMLSGARLPIISIIFCAFAVAYTYNKAWLSKNKKGILIAGICLYLVFNVYSFFRSDVFNIVSNVQSSDLSLVEILLPNETLTSYMTYDAMISSPDVFYENQFTKIIPSSIREVIGLSSFVPYSARLQDIQQTVSTLTVPLPVDLYFGSFGSLIGVFIYALIIYLIANRLFVHYSRLEFGALLMLWTYIIAFYFVRTEAIAWFSRLLLMFVYGLPVLFVLGLGQRKSINPGRISQ